MPSVPGFIGPAYETRSRNFSADRLVNLYPEITETGESKNVGVFYGTPGLRRTHTLSGTGGIRGFYRTKALGRVFAVRSDSLYELSSTGGSTLVGTLQTTSGPVSMADNGQQLIVVDGSRGYILTLGTGVFAQITDPDFPATNQVVYLDGFFVFPFPGTGRFGITGLFEGFTVDSLDFATAEGAPDNLVAILTDHRELFLFGSSTIEVFFNAGNVDFPFARIQGAFIEYGCGAAFSVANLDNTVYWLGSEERGQHQVFRADGYQPRRISTHAIEHAISGYSAQSIANSRAYTYWQGGHPFYVLNFDEATWTYDVSTQMWHERSYRRPDGIFTRHRGHVHAVGFSEQLVGDFEDGRIYALDLETFDDDGDELVSIRSTPHLFGADLQRVRYHWLQLDMETGVGVDGDAASHIKDPRVLMRFSDDGGHTWSYDKEARIGKIGEHRNRVFWERLGESRDRIWEIRQSDPVRRAWIDLKYRATPGSN